MLHELLPEQFAEVAPLVKNLSYRPAVDAVLQGTCSGRVFVDSYPAPESCFIWERPGPLYVAGRADNDAFNESLAGFLGQHFIPSRPGWYIGYVVYSHADWEGSLPGILRDRPPVKSFRTCFLMPPGEAPADLKSRANVPPGFTLSWVDEELVKADLENIEDLRSELNHMWEPVDDFFRLALGTCVTRDDELVSWCLSEYVSESKCGIGVETVEEFQGQGLATAESAALIGRLVDMGYTVHWDAWDDNPSSQAVARKLGFPTEFEYPVYFFRHGEFENLLENGYWAAFMLHDYDAALDWFARAFDAGEPQGRHYYLLARVEALADNPCRALKSLNRAVELGWDDPEHATVNPDLAAVRELPGWASLVSRLEGKGNQDNG